MEFSAGLVADFNHLKFRVLLVRLTSMEPYECLYCTLILSSQNPCLQMLRQIKESIREETSLEMIYTRSDPGFHHSTDRKVVFRGCIHNKEGVMFLLLLDMV